MTTLPEPVPLPAAAPVPEGCMELMIFSLGGESYAVSFSYVESVITPGNIVPVPGLPGFVRGMINYRGNILPVMDLAGFLGVRRDGGGSEESCVVVQAQGSRDRHRVGLLVGGIRKIASLEIAEPPQAGEGPAPESRYHRSRVTTDGDKLLILNLFQLLTDWETQLMAG